MTGKEIMKSADNETVKQRVKAIYPHIVVSGDIDKPYYSIHWYDIEKEEIYCGFSSFKLELVRKWLEEEFEVVEADIDDLLNRQQAEIERLNEDKSFLKDEFERFRIRVLPIAKSEAIKEFAERLNIEAEKVEIDREGDFVATDDELYDTVADWCKATSDNLVKEMTDEAIEQHTNSDSRQVEINKNAQSLVKSFAEKLKSQLSFGLEDKIPANVYSFVYITIDNLVKEMVGDTE